MLAQLDLEVGGAHEKAQAKPVDGGHQPSRRRVRRLEKVLILGHVKMNEQSLRKPFTIIKKKSGPKKCSLTTNNIRQKSNRERPYALNAGCKITLENS